MMNDMDYEEMKYNYILLKNLHKIANNNNEKLNEINVKNENDIFILKNQTAELSNTINKLQKQLSDSYKRYNEMKDDYNSLVSKLEKQIKNLEN